MKKQQKMQLFTAQCNSSIRRRLRRSVDSPDSRAPEKQEEETTMLLRFRALLLRPYRCYIAESLNGSTNREDFVPFPGPEKKNL
jgi:hypothetical protein